jgi:hypothetical protein
MIKFVLSSSNKGCKTWVKRVWNLNYLVNNIDIKVETYIKDAVDNIVLTDEVYY